MAAKDKKSFEQIRELVKEFPSGAGIYLMKDADGRVLYVGKAKNLRDRVNSYFQPGADLMQSRGPKIAEMIARVTDVSYLESDSEVDAILQEARLIKDIQPAYNSQQTDDKTFPYLYVTRSPQPRSSKLYGPFASAGDLRRVVQILQRAFKFRTCTLTIQQDDDRRRFFRPCILHDINQCSGPCADLISREDYVAAIKRLRRFLESKRSVVLRQMQREMAQAADRKDYEQAGQLRDEIRALESLSDRGEVDEHVQPELFQVDPAEGLDRLTLLLDMRREVRVIEGVDVAQIQGQEAVGALVCFIDARPFRSGYRRFRIKQTEGIDDYAMIQEVLRRRYRRAGNDEELYPDVILIDGGLGQLHAAQETFRQMEAEPPMVVALAKKEELLYVQNMPQALRLPRNDAALRLVQYVRDEAHRFARHYFHILQQKRTLKEQ